MNPWSRYLREGRQYLAAARNGYRGKRAFNNELVYNLIGLSVEKFLVGLCLHRGHLPADHTLAGMVIEAHRLCPLEPSLAEAIRMMDRVQDLCSLEVNVRCTVSDPQIESLLAMNERVAAYVSTHTAAAPGAQVAAT